MTNKNQSTKSILSEVLIEINEAIRKVERSREKEQSAFNALIAEMTNLESEYQNLVSEYQNFIKQLEVLK